MDEVLVFKQFECYKKPDYWGDDAPVFTIYHTDIDHPDTTWRTEKRKSAEHRVRVFYK